MNQKPVAHLMVDRNDGNSYIQIGVPTRDEKISHQPYPLYTHPIKELTDEVKDALMDALSGWKYIRECHGDLYGVGWDRVQDKLEAILRKAQAK